MVKNLHANAGDIRDAGSIPGLGRSSEGEHVTHSSILCPMDRGGWPATVRRVIKSRI